MKKNYIKNLVLVALVLIGTMANAQNVIGYLRGWQATDGEFPDEENHLMYEYLTHVHFSFIKPATAANGTLAALPTFDQSRLTNLVYQAHKYGTKVILAVGGATASTPFGPITANASYRSTFVTNLINAVQTNNCDGIDIDWEFPATWAEGQGLDNLMTDLKTALATLSTTMGRTLTLSMAVPAISFNSGYINSTALSKCDYVNLMAYDNSAEQNHSSYNLATQSVTYWNGTKGVAKNKLALGVPFYGKPWGQTTVVNYNKLSGSPATFADVDYNAGSGVYYNGRPTICSKANYTKTQGLFGIMAWELSNDFLKGSANESYSLLKEIGKCLSKTTCNFPTVDVGSVTSLCSGSKSFTASTTAPSPTYVWKKGATTVSSTAACTATSTGTYEVTVTSSGCIRTASVIVEAQSQLAVKGDTVCKSGNTGTLKVLTGGGPFTWYAAPTGGASLATGQTYSPVVTANATYYVEGAGKKEYSVGPAVSWKGGWYNDYTAAGYDNRLNFTVIDDLTIDSVTVYIGTSGNKSIDIVIYKSDNITVQQKVTVTKNFDASGKQTIPVGISLTPGTYFWGWNGGSTNTTLYLENTGSTYGTYKITNLIAFNYDTYYTGTWQMYTDRYPGMYNVQVSRSGGGVGGCTRAAVNAVLDPCLGIEENTNNNFSVYPNPANNQFTIDLSLAQKTKVTVDIYNTVGEKLYSQTTGEVNSSKIVIGTENLASGLYLVKVSANEKSSVQTLLINK